MHKLFPIERRKVRRSNLIVATGGDDVTCTLETAHLRLTPRHAEVVLSAGSAGERLDGRFSGPEPRVRGDGAEIAVSYPRFRVAQPLTERVAELRLDPSVAWTIDIEG